MCGGEENMNLFGISSIGVVVTSLSMCVLLLMKGEKTKLNTIWIYYTSFAVFWGIVAINIARTTDYERAYLLWRIGYLTIIPVPALFLHFICTLLMLHKKNLIRVTYFGCALVVLVDLFKPDLLLGELVFAFNQFYWTFKPGPVAHVYTFICIIGVIFYAHYLLIRALKYSHNISRNKVIYCLIGSIVGWLGVILCFLTNYLHSLYPYGQFLIIFYPPIFTYAVIKYKLMDVNIALQKSLVYSILVAVITSIYFIFVLGLSHLFQGFVGYQSFVVNISIVFLVALLFNPLRDWIQQVLDKKLFHGTLESLEREGQRLRQELFQAEKLAYVGQLASSVAHEIRNPLTAIETFINYLPEKYHEPDFRAKFQTLIPKEISRIKTVVNNLLDLARPGKLVKREMDVNALLDSTLELLANHFSIKKIAIKRQYESPEMFLYADEGQLKQVFLNLFLNAVQAMEEGGEFTVSTGRWSLVAGKQSLVTSHQSPAPSDSIKITITDTGHGIPPEQLNKLFTPFQTTKRDGIGLGLVITKEIIEQHGGTITAQSQVEQGTTFIIQLPIQKV